MNRPWMPLYIADYLADTAHLSAAESGAYLHLIMHYWQRGGLPSDDRQLARIAKMTTEEWSASKSTIAAFFDEGWRHGRVEDEIAAATEAYEKRAAAGAKGGKARTKLKQSASIASAKLNQPPSQSHSSLRSEEDGGRARDELDQMFEAAGDSLRVNSPALQHRAELNRWLHAGASFELDILPAISAKAASTKAGSVHSWAFFTQVIADTRERRISGLPPGNPNTRADHAKHSGPTGVAAVARRIADEARAAEREQFGTVLAIGRG